MQQFYAVFGWLWNPANPTLNLAKSKFGKSTVSYLGKVGKSSQ